MSAREIVSMFGIVALGVTGAIGVIAVAVLCVVLGTAFFWIPVVVVMCVMKLLWP